ncbi:MAG: hypothetical protein R2911_41430 [Caldilineaceae bacterium]
MREQPKITTLFLDIGGVLLTNGWDHESRRAPPSASISIMRRDERPAPSDF